MGERRGSKIIQNCVTSVMDDSFDFNYYCILLRIWRHCGHRGTTNSLQTLGYTWTRGFWQIKNFLLSKHRCYTHLFFIGTTLKSGTPRFVAIVQMCRLFWWEQNSIFEKTKRLLRNLETRDWYQLHIHRVSPWPKNWALSSILNVQLWPGKASKLSLMKQSELPVTQYHFQSLSLRKFVRFFNNNKNSNNNNKATNKE